MSLELTTATDLQLSGIRQTLKTVGLVGNQTISGIKTFSQGISVTGGSINLIGRHVIDQLKSTGESIILQGGSGIGNGNLSSAAEGGSITLIGGTAGSGGMGGTLPGNITLIGGSGRNNQFVPDGDNGFGRINLYAAPRNNDPRGGDIVLKGNIRINPENIESRNFIVYKTGDGIAAANNLTVSQNAVTVNNPIFADNLVYNTGNQTISGIKSFANGSNQILNTTYSTLTGLKATSGLLSGQLYRISDFVLKWNNQSINDQTVKTAASGEPLIVTALSNKQIYHLAQSEIYPQDTIYYNIDASGSYSWGTINNNASIPDFKGWIYRRVDNLLDIDIPYDWRNITVNCCKPDVSSVPNYSGNFQYTKLEYVKETGNNSNRGKLYYSLVTGNSGNALSNTNFWSPVSDFVESGTFFSTDEDYGFRALYEEANLGDFIINLPALTSSRIQQPTFTSTLTGLGTFTLDNVKNIKIEGGYSNVIIGNDFNSNTIGNSFYLNTIGNYFNSNTIGNSFYYNTIRNSFYLNTIGNNFYYNTIRNSFNSNAIGNNFSSNTIGNSFNYNTIGNRFNSNTIGNSFYLNTISNSFYSNTIGEGVQDNTISNNFYFNTISNGFYSNTIGNNFNYNTIGNNFRFNTSEDYFNSINFSTSTHVYNSYNTTLFQNSANSMRLRYFNSSDQLVVTDPTA